MSVLQLKCLQDFIQDGDSAIHHSCHASTSVDGQRGCILPHTGGCSTPPVPQIQLAGHKLPIQNPFVWSVISPQAFTKTLAPLIAWLRLLGIQLYSYPNDLIVGDSEVEVTQSVQKTIQVLILITCVRSFSKIGAYKPAHQFLSLLGLMAAMLQSEYAHLYMRPIQWYLKQSWTHTTHQLHHPIFVRKDLVHVLLW